LQLCVYLGPADGDAREHAERLFHSAQANTRPAVMLYVAPDARRVECVVAPQLADRIPDAAAQEAIDVMVPVLSAGDVAGGLAAGLRHIAAVAGPPRGDEPDEQLPDIVG
jgi:uncharacterized membrane protein YgcG